MTGFNRGMGFQERPFLAGFPPRPKADLAAANSSIDPLADTIARLDAGEFDRRPESIEALALEALGEAARYAAEQTEVIDQQS